MFRDIVAHVSPFALRLVLKQWEKVQAGVLNQCTNVFTTTSGLPCAHRIRNRMGESNGAGIVRLRDIHPHWRFEKPASHLTRGHVNELEDDDNIDPLLTIQEPAIAHTKGRPRGQQELPTRAEVSAQRSTQRNPSHFEQVEQYLTQRSSDNPSPRVGTPSRRGTRGGATPSRRGTGGGGATPTRGSPLANTSEAAERMRAEADAPEWRPTLGMSPGRDTPPAAGRDTPSVAPRGRGIGGSFLSRPARRRPAPLPEPVAPAALPDMGAQPTPGLPLVRATIRPIPRPAGRGYGTPPAPQARSTGGYRGVYDPDAW